MEKSESIKELSAALAKAQGQMRGALKDSNNPYFKSKYADLASVVEAIREPFATNGLSYVQIAHDAESAVKIETVIMHSSGEWMSLGVFSVPVTKDDAQGYGSAGTYCRRYSLMLVGVAPEDDDGNAAAAAKPKAFEKPHKPTDGAVEGLPEDEQTWVHDISNDVRKLLSKGDIAGACDHVDEQNFNADQKVALWAKLSDTSAGRAAMKKHWESKKVA